MIALEYLELQSRLRAAGAPVRDGQRGGGSPDRPAGDAVASSGAGDVVRKLMARIRMPLAVRRR